MMIIQFASIMILGSIFVCHLLKKQSKGVHPNPALLGK